MGSLSQVSGGMPSLTALAVPWAEKSSRFTLMFEAFAIAVFEAARSLEAGRQLLGLSWDSANTIISRAVKRGLAQRDISEVTRVGIDEKSFLRTLQKSTTSI